MVVKSRAQLIKARRQPGRTCARGGAVRKIVRQSLARVNPRRSCPADLERHASRIRVDIVARGVASAETGRNTRVLRDRAARVLSGVSNTDALINLARIGVRSQ